MKDYQMPNPKRDQRIWELKEKGLSLRDIAKLHDLSYERVRKICQRMEKEVMHIQVVDKKN